MRLLPHFDLYGEHSSMVTCLSTRQA